MELATASDHDDLWPQLELEPNRQVEVVVVDGEETLKSLTQPPCQCLVRTLSLKMRERQGWHQTRNQNQNQNQEQLGGECGTAWQAQGIALDHRHSER